MTVQNTIVKGADKLPDAQKPDFKLEMKGLQSSASGPALVTVVDDEKGIVETLVSVTGIEDRVKDVILPGAYAKTLKNRRPKGILNHDWAQTVSKVLEMKELMPGDPELPKSLPNGDPWPAEAGALYIKAQYNLGTARGRDAYSDAKFYDNDQEWSIGFNVSPGNARKDANTGIRYIKELELFEYSQVLWGAMPNARTQKVKDATAGDEGDDGTDDGDDDTQGALFDIEDWKGLTADQTKELALDAIKSVATFLNGIGTMPDATYLKVMAMEDDDMPDIDEEVDPAADYESLSDAVLQIASHALSKEELKALSDLADTFDTAIDGDDDKAITDSESALIDALKKFIDAAEGEDKSDLEDLAAVMGSMLGVTPDDEDAEDWGDEDEGDDDDASADKDTSDDEGGKPDAKSPTDDSPVMDSDTAPNASGELVGAGAKSDTVKMDTSMFDLSKLSVD